MFTDETLDNALLPQGAVATATDRLREVVGQGLAEFLTTIDQINTSVQTASTASGNWVWSMTPVARPLPDRGSLRPGDQRRPDRTAGGLAATRRRCPDQDAGPGPQGTPVTDERARADARMAAHSGWRAEAERNAGRRVADQEAAAAARAATPEGQAARIASGIFGTSARRADGDRIVDGLNLDR